MNSIGRWLGITSSVKTPQIPVMTASGSDVPKGPKTPSYPSISYPAIPSIQSVPDFNNSALSNSNVPAVGYQTREAVLYPSLHQEAVSMSPTPFVREPPARAMYQTAAEPSSPWYSQDTRVQPSSVPEMSKLVNSETRAYGSLDLQRAVASQPAPRIASSHLSAPTGNYPPLQLQPPQIQPPQLQPSPDNTQHLYAEIARLQVLLGQAQTDRDQARADTDSALDDLDAQKAIASKKAAENASMALELASNPTSSINDATGYASRQLKEVQAKLQQVEGAASDAADKAQRVQARAAKDVREMKARNDVLEAELQAAAKSEKADNRGRQEEVKELRELVAFYKNNSKDLSGRIESLKGSHRTEHQLVLESDQKIRDLEGQIRVMSRLGAE